MIDKYATPQLQWLTLGGAELKPDGAGMRATYEQKDETVSGIVAADCTWQTCVGKESLAFEVASDKPAQLLLTFEELATGKQQGPGTTRRWKFRAAGSRRDREVLLSAFEHGPDSPEDANGKLDPDQLKTFSILDITGTSYAPDGGKFSLDWEYT